MMQLQGEESTSWREGWSTGWQVMPGSMHKQQVVMQHSSQENRADVYDRLTTSEQP